MSDLYDLAYRAFSGTSFSPDRRATDTVKWIEQQLAEDLDTILKGSWSTDGYQEKYLAHASKWLNAKSRVMSTMITGPANFPVARNQRFLNHEESVYKLWMGWRERYIKAVFRKPTPSPEEDLDDALKEYERVAQLQELMKSANKIIRDKKEHKSERLIELGYKEKQAEIILKPNCMGNIGFASYTLTNNNAKIKRLKDKVLIMKNRIARKESFEPIPFEGGSIDIQADRVCIFHDDKPEKDVRDKMKARGFHWSHNYECWSRKHTARALYDAKEIIGV